MSAGLQLVETIIRAFVDRCNPAALNAVIDTLNADPPADVDDSYRLLEPFVPDSVRDYITPPSALHLFPSIGTRHVIGRLEDDNAWSATGVWNIGLCLFYAHADPAVLQRRIRRYTVAMSRVALAGRQIGDRPWGITASSWNFGPPMAQREGTDDYITWVELVVTGKHDEE